MLFHDKWKFYPMKLENIKLDERLELIKFLELKYDKKLTWTKENLLQSVKVKGYTRSYILLFLNTWVFSSAGRASRLHRESQRFEPVSTYINQGK